LNPDSYEWDLDSAKGCDVTYSIRIEFKKGTNRVEVLMCLWCSVELIFVNGQYVSGHELDKIRDEVLTVIQPLFPNDSSIQELKPRSR